MSAIRKSPTKTMIASDASARLGYGFNPCALDEGRFHCELIVV